MQPIDVAVSQSGNQAANATMGQSSPPPNDNP